VQKNAPRFMLQRVHFWIPLSCQKLARLFSLCRALAGIKEKRSKREIVGGGSNEPGDKLNISINLIIWRNIL